MKGWIHVAEIDEIIAMHADRCGVWPCAPHRRWRKGRGRRDRATGPDRSQIFDAYLDPRYRSGGWDIWCRDKIRGRRLPEERETAAGRNRGAQDAAPARRARRSGGVSRQERLFGPHFRAAAPLPNIRIVTDDVLNHRG